MPLPGVNISIISDALGGVANIEDSISGLALSGPAATGLALNEPKAIFSVEEAEALGIDASYDSTNSVDVYQQIVDFYDAAFTGIELWIVLFPQTTTMALACDANNQIVRKLLDEAEGRIKIWGINRIPDGAYVPTYVDGIDDDVNAAVLNADDLCKQLQTEHNPCRAFIGARDFQGDVGNLRDFKQNNNERVEVFLGSLTDAGSPSIGHLVGTYASLPVHRKASRVKNGDIGKTAAYLSDGNDVKDYKSAWDALNDKGYTFYRKHPNISGFYFSSDPTCVSDANDFSSMAYGRLIDKANRILFATTIEEVDNEVDIDAGGNIEPVTIKSYQNKIKNALVQGMEMNLSYPAKDSVRVEINPSQNVLATSELNIAGVFIKPKGFSSFINVPLGLDNPNS